MSQSIAGSVAFVTGANRGIGAALTRALLERGAAKVYAAGRQLPSLDALVAEGAGRVVAVALDVTDPDAVKAAAALASDTTLLINNAGVAKGEPRTLGDETSASDLRQELEVNAVAPHIITHAFSPALIAAGTRSEGRTAGGATVVNIGSAVAFANFPQAPTYSASKAALHSLTQAWRRTLAPHRVDVLEVYPGPVDTDMAREIPMDKTPAPVVAHAILDGVEHATQDILPDVIAQSLGTEYFRAPKRLEQQISAQVWETPATVLQEEPVAV